MDDNSDKGREEKLTDEELARLLDPSLDPETRRQLVDRLGNDPDSARILGMAGGSIPASGDNLSEKTIEKLLDTVKKHDRETGLCPHCAGDLHDSGNYCPHCGLKVKGDTVNCMNCGKPVVEGSVYCPSCGSMFGEVPRRSLIDSRYLMFIIGLVSISVAVMLGPGLPSVIFVLLGMIALLGWLAEFLGVRKTRSKAGQYEIRKIKKSEDKKKDESGRRMG